MQFTIDTKLQDYIDTKRHRGQNSFGRTETEVVNLQEIEHALYLMADLRYQEDNLDLDKFQIGYEFGLKSHGKEIHAVEWDDGVFNGTGPEYIVFIGTMEEIMVRLKTIPVLSSKEKVILNDRRLTKDVCLKCHKKYIEDCEPGNIELQLEQKWQLEGKLYCPGAGLWGDDINVHNSPPEGCPYLVEHIVCIESKTER